MGDDDQIRAELDSLQEEHQNLDAMIGDIGVTTTTTFDQLQMRRLKKRKLWLKDRISFLHSQLEPDIIA